MPESLLLIWNISGIAAAVLITAWLSRRRDVSEITTTELLCFASSAKF